MQSYREVSDLCTVIFPFRFILHFWVFLGGLFVADPEPILCFHSSRISRTKERQVLFERSSPQHTIFLSLAGVRYPRVHPRFDAHIVSPPARQHILGSLLDTVTCLSVPTEGKAGRFFWVLYSLQKHRILVCRQISHPMVRDCPHRINEKCKHTPDV